MRACGKLSKLLRWIALSGKVEFPTKHLHTQEGEDNNEEEEEQEQGGDGFHGVE